MPNKYDMLTNEGSLALARAVATGAKLSIRGASLCKVDSGMATVEAVAACTWAPDPDRPERQALKPSAIEGAVLPCTSYLPSMPDIDGVETGSPVAALDIEFTFMPSSEVQYNVIAVLADLYYMFAPFEKRASYRVGDTVWYLDNEDNYTYYRCIKDIERTEVYPIGDTEHWQRVQVYNQLDTSTDTGNLQYRSITEEPVLLYVSKTAGYVTVGPEMEIDYKVRLYLEGVDNAASVREYVVFDTLGPEFMDSTKIELLAYFAQAMQHIRDVAVERAGRP